MEQTMNGQIKELALDEQTILIVDDNPANLSILTDYLIEYNFQILVARSGQSALQKLERILPDIILLDVMMPGIDGFEVCRQIKADERTKDIPVIFLTALSNPADKIRGFQVGAVDYITKPLHHEEVFARVITHLNIWHLRRNLQQQNQHLQQVTSELEEKSRLLTKLNNDKDRFFSIISHDLRGPFHSVVGYSDLLMMMIDSADKDKIKNLGLKIQGAARSTYLLLENLLQWAQIQRGRMPHDPQNLRLAELAGSTINLLEGSANEKGIRLHNLVDENIAVYVDENMIDTVVRNLTSNAIKFTKQDGNIKISACLIDDDKHVEITVADDGVGINPEDVDKLFRVETRFSTVGTSNEAGTGLGLILCKQMVEENQGRIWVESVLEKGTSVKFTVPVGDISQARF
jgi:signal transduction histidine kinase